MFTTEDKYGDTQWNLFTLIPAIIIGIAVLLTILSGFYIVEPGQVAFEKTFGKINPTINSEGLYFKNPFITSAVKMNTRNIVVTATASSSSKDVQIVTTEVAVNFSLQSSKAIQLYSTIGLEKAITETVVSKAIQESIKAATAKFTATESITEREKVRQVMVDNLNAKLNPRGIIINQLDITDFKFSPEFDKSIEAKVTAEQDALKSKALVEKVKYEAEAKIAQAQGEAKAVEIAAIAEAQAIKIKANAIQAQGGEDYIKLKHIEKWNGSYPTTMLSDGSNVLLNIK